MPFGPGVICHDTVVAREPRTHATGFAARMFKIPSTFSGSFMAGNRKRAKSFNIPEHAHVLFWPTAAYEIKAIRSSLKWPIAQKAIRFVNNSAPSFLERMKDEQPNGKIA